MRRAGQALKFAVNSLTAVAVAAAILLVLAQAGLISKPASQDFTLGG